MDNVKRGPGRPKKQERRRKGKVGKLRAKLAVSDKDPRFEYRWINDTKTRVADLTKLDDWDLVQDPSKSMSEDGTDLGSAVSKIVGREEGGEPIRAYLVRKPKEYYDADKKAAQRNIEDTMDQIKAGGNAAVEPTSYVPEGGIVIQEGAKT